METIYTFPELERYIDRDFRPCAIVCSICGDRSSIYGLERTHSLNEGISVFMGSGFTYDEYG